MISSRSGFTLVEIMVVISLLGALTFGTSLGINKQLSKTRDAQRKLQLKGLAKALEEYYDSTLCYPSYLPACGTPFMLGNAMLLDTVPCDPLSNIPYFYDTNHSVCNSKFYLYATLENKQDTDIKYLGCEWGCGPWCSYNYGHSSTNTYLEACQPPITPTPTSQPTEIPIPTQAPSSPPTSTPILTSIPYTPTNTPIPNQYVCAPGMGNNGHCEVFLYPELSDCPVIWINDPTCRNQCGVRENHCKSSKGKKN